MGFGPRVGIATGRLGRVMWAGALGIAVSVSATARAEQPDPPSVPLTSNAGMGTSEPVPPRASGGVDTAGSTAGTAAHVPLTTPLPPRTTPPAPRAMEAATPVRGGVDSAGDTPLSAATPAQAQSPAQAPATAQSAAQGQSQSPAPPAAAAEAPPATPLPPVAQAIAAQLATPESITSSRKEQEALVTFYGARQDMPVFVDEKGLVPRGAAVIARLEAAAEDGLDPADYAVSAPRAGADAAQLARTELKLAAAVLTYARHAQSGRFDPGRISALVTPVRDIPDPVEILTKVAYAADANAALAGFNPPHAGYKALKAQLAKAAGRTTPAIAAIADGPQVRPGARDARMPALRTRLGITAAAQDEQAYDPALVEAVKAFQESAGIKPTGIIGPSTLKALNAGATPGGGSLKADVIANMERWRWLPRDLGEMYVMVNIPEFMVRVMNDGRKIHETRVVVGKPETPTPLLSREMKYIVVNPAWNIPPSIARNEMMPLLRSDPSALSRRGIQVVRNGSGGYSFRQSPGERNALGRIKFMFPNDHSVYLHDTPSRALFQNDRRAYSHGCVRVYQPLEFGEVIFNLGLPGDGWTEGRIAKMFGSSERYINLKQRFPVHIVYFNLVFDDAGRMVVREDLYGINAEVKTLLGLDGKRRIADGTGPRAPKTR